MPSNISFHQRLDKLRTEYEHIVDAIKTVQAIDERKAARNGHSILADALAIDAARVARPKKVRGQGSKATVRRRRQTAKLLRTLSRTEPRPVKGPTSIGVLMRHGYIMPKGDGYVRTDKEFEI